MSDLSRYPRGTVDLRTRLEGEEVRAARAEGWLFDDPSRTRPRYFDGRFLAARDLKQDQEYFLRRQRDLLQVATLGVVEGLRIRRGSNLSVLVIEAGHGLTEAGAMLWIGEETPVDFADVARIQGLDNTFDLEQRPNEPVRNRSGVFILALRGVEYTANPVASYPETIQGPRALNDGEIIEAAAVTLIPLENVAASDLEVNGQSRLAREMFVRSGLRRLDAHALPLAVVALNRGEVSWFDEHMVRREASAPEGVGFGRAEREAYVRQYTEQLRAILGARVSQAGLRPLAANDMFRALPAFGPMPAECVQVSGDALTQTFFPAQMPVEITLVPEDELPALVEDVLALPPIDLESSAAELSEMPVLVLIPIPRSQFATTIATLEGELTQSPAKRLSRMVPRDRPIAALQRFRQLLRDAQVNAPPTPRLQPWQTAINDAKNRERESLTTRIIPGEHAGMFYVRLRRGDDTTFAASRFSAFPSDSPEPSETFSPLVRNRLVTAGELEVLSDPPSATPHTTFRLDFMLRHATNGVAQAVEGLFGQPGFARDVIVNGAIAELSYLTRIRLEELIRSHAARSAQVDLDVQGVLAPAGSLPVRVRKLSAENVATVASRYADSALGQGFQALVALAPDLATAPIRKVLADSLRVPELDATARALDAQGRTKFATDLLAFARAGDLVGIRDLADIRVGPVVGAPDEVVWNPIAGFPGSDVAVRIGEGALYHLVHNTANAEVRTSISDILASTGLDYPFIITTLLVDALVEGFDLDLSAAPPVPVNNVLAALDTFAHGGDFDPEEAKAPTPAITRTADIQNLFSRYNGLKGGAVLPLMPQIGERFTPFTLNELRTIGLAGERTGVKIIQNVWTLVQRLNAAPAAGKPAIETQLQNFMTSLRSAAQAHNLTTLRTLSQGV